MLLPGLESQSYIPYERTEIEKMLDTWGWYLFS
jgi:hypothetical protein